MNAEQALNKLAKWRVLLTGWQLGTRPKGDPEADAVRDQRELLLLLRVEMNALTALLIDRGVITREQWDRFLQVEAAHMEADLEHRFPGVRATDQGLVFDQRAAETMKGWRP